LHPEFPWRYALSFLEDFKKVISEIESGSDCDLIDWNLSLRKQALGYPEPGTRQAVYKSNSEVVFEYPADVSLGISELFR